MRRNVAKADLFKLAKNKNRKIYPMKCTLVFFFPSKFFAKSFQPEIVIIFSTNVIKLFYSKNITVQFDKVFYCIEYIFFFVDSVLYFSLFNVKG